MRSRSNNEYLDPSHWEARFQQAALEPGRWLEALGELADATGSTRGELIGISGSACVFNWISACDEAMLRDFAIPESHSPHINYRVAAGAASDVLTIVDEADYERVRPALASDLYIELCERHYFPFGCQTTLMRSEGALLGLSIHRSRRDGRTTEQARAIFRHAAPGVLAAVRLQQAVEQQGLRLLEGTLEAMSSACLILDGLGTVRAMTPAAEDMLRAHPTLRTSSGRLGSSSPADDRRLQLALREVLGGAGPASLRVPIRSNPAGRLLLVEVLRLPRQDWAMHFAARALVRLRDPGDAPAPDAKLLAELFSLTPAEAQVAAALAQGSTREEIALSRRVSHETVRAQLKSLYLKAGCQRESQLVLLLRSLLA